ncbi:TonB-dependent siderophore receptor [Sphingomonas sp. MA1305]|uniref:TonB-dependent receptor n=1 Tax=Sphingomonas sp. MA1305 TaxID=2479204 RepID=UPI0018DFF85C|nr:TonB-dependent receptor [Sphingomonas sp. MA1305]MBI0476144.1 TonB-dependent siderophore receptor [Sphingomonas sp. MA1305]
MSRSSASFLALSCVGFIATAPAAAAPADRVHAADDQDGRRKIQRDDIVVTDKAEKAPNTVESPKATASILDTPQTITVISDQVLRKQNLQTLRDALQTIPGITFGAGEGGGGYGDSINLRGYSANTDITIDGIRDTAQYSRTDPFNLQQIEVYNGANSVFNGSGSVGGTINLVTKEPRPEDLTIAQGSVGTDNYYRAAVDSNVRVSDTVAARVNAVYHHNDVPGRDVEKYERWGVAPAVTIGMGGPTSLTLAYVHQEDRNTPLYGVPYFNNALVGGLITGADRSDYYGYSNLDTQRVTVDRLTATFRHSVDDHVSVRNLARWQRVGQYSITSAPQGTFCLAGTGRQPVATSASDPTGLSCTTNVAGAAFTIPAGQWLPSGPRGLVRDQENQLLADQVDLRLEHGVRGGVRNVADIGAIAMVEDYRITTGSLLRNADGSALAALPLLAISHPDSVWRGATHYVTTAQSKSTTQNVAVYAFDTLELGRFFELNGGLRWEYQKANFRALPIPDAAPGVTQPLAAQLTPQINRERLFSWRAGAVFHPVRDVSIYAGYGTAKTPSSASVRAGCVSVSGTVVTNTCNVAPENARNYEAGVKAGLFHRKLELTAAVFRNERTNYRIPSNDPALPTVQVLDGRSRVDGIALGASGNITRDWTIFANYTYLDGKVLQSVSNFCLARPGAAGCGNSVAVPDPQAGAPLVQTPEHSGSLFTTYKLPFGLEVGYGLTYQGSFTTYVPNLVSGTPLRAPDYLIHRAYLAYTVGGGLTAQLNVQNLTDEKYLTNVRNNLNANGVVTGGWAMPGDRRQAVLSLFYSF